MDDDRARRIEQSLDKLVRESVPREEMTRTFERMESKLDAALATQGSHATKIAVLETKVASVDDHDERIEALENQGAATLSVKSHRRDQLVGLGALIAGAWWVPDFIRHALNGGGHG